HEVRLGAGRERGIRSSGKRRCLGKWVAAEVVEEEAAGRAVDVLLLVGRLPGHAHRQNGFPRGTVVVRDGETTGTRDDLEARTGKLLAVAEACRPGREDRRGVDDGVLRGEDARLTGVEA